MAGGRFDVTTVIDKPIEAVFAYLAAGTNDPQFSPRVQKIEKVGDGPVGVGTHFVSTVKDAGMTTKRDFEYTHFEAPICIRWVERSSNSVFVTEGGYDLEPSGTGTKVTLHNTLAGKGFGKLVVGFALKQAQKTSGEFGAAIKKAAEANA